MATRLPADWQTRSRLEGKYKLRIVLCMDISKAKYNTDQVSTVRGSSARNMPVNDDDHFDTPISSSPRRLIKMVLADQADRLLIAYEYTRWREGVNCDTLRVGQYCELQGPVLMVEGVAMLTDGNLLGISSGEPPLHPVSHVDQSAVPSHSEWIDDDLPSDLFVLSQDHHDHDNVIVIDE